MTQVFSSTLYANLVKMRNQKNSCNIDSPKILVIHNPWVSLVSTDLKVKLQVVMQNTPYGAIRKAQRWRRLENHGSWATLALTLSPVFTSSLFLFGEIKTSGYQLNLYLNKRVGAVWL